MAFLVTLLLAGASLVALYKYLVHPAFLSPLAKVPAANFCARLSTLWISYIRWRNVENRAVLALHAKHGPIVLLGPNEVSINCYEGGLKTVYGGGFAKTDFYPLQFAFYGYAAQNYVDIQMSSHRLSLQRPQHVQHRSL